MPKRKVDPAMFNWLTPNDHGKLVLVTGHHAGDFMGIVKYGGRELAIITDMADNDHEICYMHPIQFKKLGI